MAENWRILSGNQNTGTGGYFWEQYFKFNVGLLCLAPHKSYLHSNQAIIYLKFTHFGHINNQAGPSHLDPLDNSQQYTPFVCLWLWLEVEQE